MTFELKTLNDLEWKNDFGEGEIITNEINSDALKDGTYPTVKINDLKEEAIKWIIFLRDYNAIAKTDLEKKIQAMADNIEWKQCLKLFFNITNEELK